MNGDRAACGPSYSGWSAKIVFPVCHWIGATWLKNLDMALSPAL